MCTKKIEILFNVSKKDTSSKKQSKSFKMSFTIMIKESMESTLQRFGAEIAEKVVNICAEKYGFEAVEAFNSLGDIRVNRQGKENAKPRRATLVKPSFPLPYSGEYDENKCHALRQNQGLYTQCQTAKSHGSFCNQCQKLSKKSETGIPEYGLIEQRKAKYDANEVFMDPRGRKETPYYKIMNRYKLTIEQVNEEAEKFGITVNADHFKMPETGRRGRPAQEKVAKEPKGSKGRPKKEKKVIQIEGEDDDLFAALVASANSDDESDFVSEKEAKRLEEKAEREAKLTAEKAEMEAKIAAEKEARELKLATEKAEKEAREIKRLQDKAEREAKLAAEKAERDAKEAKRIQEKAEKEAKLAAEKAEKEAKKKAEKEAKKPSSSTQDSDDEPEVVKKITFNDKKYLLSKKSLIIYDYEKYIKEQEQVVVGKWNEAEQKIVFNSSEESEDEYDSDDDEEITIGGGVSGV